MNGKETMPNKTDITTLQVSNSLNQRIKVLAGIRAKQMGLSKPLSRVTWLELIIKEEENKSNAN